MYTLYILFSEKIDKFYVGYTNDMERRLTEHNRHKGKFTDSGIPWKLVYSEKFDSKSDAMNREQYIKKQKSRTFIINLISSSAGSASRY